MAKRLASEALEELLGIGSPSTKRSRLSSPSDTNGDTHTRLQKLRIDSRAETTTNGHASAETKEPEQVDEEEEEEDEDEDEDEDESSSDEDDITTTTTSKAPLRQAAPTQGYDDLYLDTINRNVLDFDFEKLCSISLSNINVYACLICGRYFQGRGPKSHAYFHALEEGNHHVFINMATQRVYVLPEGYEVKGRSLDDIKFVSDPRYTKREVGEFDRVPRTSRTLLGREYSPGFVGMNNIKENDYLNVVVQALSHVSPLRNYFLLEDFTRAVEEGSSSSSSGNNGSNSKHTTITKANTSTPYSELVKRTSILFRKIWNPRAFKSHVSPHELLQEISLRSNKRFTLTAQSDPVEFLSWYLNNLHVGLGGSKTKPGTSMIQRTFQGRLKVESQAITAKADVGDRLRFEDAAEVKTDISRFLFLTLDLPAAPLFQDEESKNIIPQVPLSTILAKYDGHAAQEHLSHRRRYKLLHPLPPYLVFHVKRFSTNKFVSERNPTIVTFEPRNLNVAPYVEKLSESSNSHRRQDAGIGGGGGGGEMDIDTEADTDTDPEPIWYDLVANVVHEAVRVGGDVSDSTGEEKRTWKVQLRDRARGDEWVVVQDLFVEKVQAELLYLGETYLQIWERRKTPAVAKGRM